MKDFTKPTLVVLFVAVCLSNLCTAQNLDYGVKFLYNSSAHTNFDPTIPEDGEFLWNALGTFGFGAYVSKRLNRHFISSLSLLYQEKGYKEIPQLGVAVPGRGFSESRLRNIFNYLSMDAQIHFVVIQGRNAELSLGIGIEYNYLLDYTIQSDFNPINQSYPVNAYQDRWKQSNMSWIPSVVLNINQMNTLEFGLNRSITPVLETENLVVKDWIRTTRVGLSIPELFK